MKIKNVEELQEKIDSELSWRKKELFNFSLIIRSNNDPILCKLGIALLSAHFEGLVKKIANYYIIFVSGQRKKACELKRNFTALSISKYVEKYEKNPDLNILENCAKNLLDDEIFSIKYTDEHPIIKTKGNPSSSLLKNIFGLIGLDFSPYETKVNYIDSDLLRNRHEIVHGEKTFISKSDFSDTFEHIVELMDDMAKQVVDAALNETYLI